MKNSEHKASRKEITIYVGTIGFVIIFVLVLGFLTFFDKDILKDETSKGLDDTISEQETNKMDLIKGDLQLIEISDSTILSIDGFNISLPEHYNASAAFSGTKGESFICNVDEGKLCKIYQIVNDNSTSSYYISSPSPIIFNDSSSIITEPFLINNGSLELELTLERVELFNDDMTTSDVRDILQVYGCTKNNICFASGILNQDLTINSTEVDTFINFINAISVS